MSDIAFATRRHQTNQTLCFKLYLLAPSPVLHKQRVCFVRDLWKNLSNRSIESHQCYEACISSTCTASRADLCTLKAQEFPSSSMSQTSTQIIISKFTFQTCVLLKALLLEKASGWVAWVVKEHRLRSNMFRKRPRKKLSQYIDHIPKYVTYPS